MKNIVQLSDNLFGLLIPIESYNIELNFIEPYFHTNMILKETEDYKRTQGQALMFVDFGGKKNYPKELSILGTSSLKEITFDCEPYVEKINYKPHGKEGKLYKDYDFSKDFTFWNSKHSFYSLLASKGITPNEEFKVLILTKQ